MAGNVMHLPAAVDSDKHQRAKRRDGRSRSWGIEESGLEPAAIGKPGQRVLLGHPAHRFPAFPLFGDVLLGAVESCWASMGDDDAGGQSHPTRFPIGSKNLRIEVKSTLPCNGIGRTEEARVGEGWVRMCSTR